MSPDTNLPPATGPLWLLPSLGPLLAEPYGSPGQSAWWRHAPFAGWLLASAPPRRAAGEGEAFRALQELALRAGLATEWHGAAGGEPVDLLLLDGRWTEADVPGVTARWEPLLEPGAIVLVHGTNPGEGGSLLWHTWSQGLSPASRFEFADGAGLGMLLWDEARAPGVLRRLCDLPPAVAADFKALCAALGARWTAYQQAAVAMVVGAELVRSLDIARRGQEALRRSLALQQEKLDAALAAERALRDEEQARLLGEMRAAAQAHADENARLKARADAAAQDMARDHALAIDRLLARANAAARETALAHAEEIALLSKRALAAAQEASLAHAESIAGLSARADAAERRLSARADAAERALALAMASSSWRVARAMAGMAGRLPPSLRMAGRRAARLAGWVVTGQLLARLRRRRRARRSLPLLRSSPLFDPAWYAAKYPDVALSGLDPTQHFAVYGVLESRQPGPGFDSSWYRLRYPDVAAAGLHPLLHFLEHGAAEGRQWRAVAPLPVISVPEERRPDAMPPVPERVTPPFLLDAGTGTPALLRPMDLVASPAPLIETTAVADPAGDPNSTEALGLLQDPNPPETDSPGAARPGEAAQVASPGAPQRELLGWDLPAVTIFPVTVGFVTRNTPLAELRRAVEAAEAALEGIGQRKPGSILVSDDGAAADPSGLLPWTVSLFPPAGVPGFAAAHNRLMEAAFAGGAEVYIAAHPGGVFHPDALIGLLRMVRAGFRRALVEAARSPVPVPRPVDPRSCAVPWSCGACLAIPRQIYQAVGGFDATLDSWGADLDLSWRARAAGFTTLICPDALFELPFRDAADDGLPGAVLASAVLLARKWQLGSAEVQFTELLQRAGESLPDIAVAAVPETQRAFADFGGAAFFGDRLW